MIKMLIYIIIMLPLMITAQLTINITPAITKDKTIIEFKDVFEKCLSDTDVKLFNITNENLNAGMIVEVAKAPDNIFLKDPTDYGDTFKKFKWKQVTKQILVQQARVIKTEGKRVVLKHSVRNNTTMTILTNTNVYSSDKYENSVKSFWGADGLPADEILYNVIIDFSNNNTLKYQNKWRNNALISMQKAFGMTKSGKIYLKPGQTLVKQLSLSKIYVLVKVDFKARLVGQLVADYENLYGKYHFYAPNIGNIMAAAGLRNEIMTSEFIEIRGYINPVMDFYYTNTKRPVAFEVLDKSFISNNKIYP